ncbi:MAG: HEPN domain-containing protein [Verrucomicrobia bacterium]|nr:HEPN domain-containing protein [Prolixibacteraceae bacterium]
MSIDNQDRLNLIQYRLAEAKDTQADVELLLSHDRLRAAINRIYYGMFYSLLALGLKYGFETSKHAQLIGWFNKEFIYGGLIEIKYGKIITKAYNRRTKGDYDSYVEFDLETVKEMYEEMKDFIHTMEQFLSTQK